MSNVSKYERVYVFEIFFKRENKSKHNSSIQKTLLSSLSRESPKDIDR